MRPQDTRALSLGAIAVAIMLAYAWLVRPAFNEMQSQRALLATEYERLARERALIQAMQHFPRTRDSLNRIMETATPRLFAGDSIAAMADLASYVAETATRSLVRLSAVEGRPSTTTRGITQSQVDVRGEANWKNTIRFIHTLESSGRLLDVRSLRIERGPRGGPLGGDLLTVSATIAGYSRSAH